MGFKNKSCRIARFSGESLAAWVKNNEQSVGIFLLLLLMLVVAVYKWVQFSGNAAPPGSDGGQWLAFSHQLFGGESIRAGFQFYPPIFPLFVRLVSLVVDPLVALKLLGIFTSIFIAFPVYLLLRTALHPCLSAVFAITVVITPYHNEVLCFGGYPQLLGTSFLLLSIFFLLQGLNTGQKRWFFGASVASAATIGSNVLTALVLLLAAGVILLISSCKLWHEGKSVLYPRFRSAFLWWGIPSIILSLPFATTYFAYLFTAERSPANPMGLTLPDILGWLKSAWLLEFILWLGVLSFVAVLFLFGARAIFRRRLLITDAAVALLFSAFAGFLLLRELRFIAFIEIGLVLVLGLILNMLISFFSRQKARRFLVASTLIAVLIFTSAVGVIGNRRFEIAYYWYEVVDASVLSALEWLHDNGTPGAKVVTTGADHGHNYGWWIEGYAHLPTYMAGDPFLFFNVTERAQVSLAHRLLIQETPPGEIRALANENGIQFLFFDKRVIYRSLGNFVEAGFVKCFENDTIVVMERKTL